MLEFVCAALAHLHFVMGLHFSSKFLEVGRDLVPNHTSVGQFRPCPQVPVELQESTTLAFYFVYDLPGQILFPILGCQVVLVDVLLDQLSKHHISRMAHIGFARPKDHVVQGWAFDNG